MPRSHLHVKLSCEQHARDFSWGLRGNYGVNMALTGMLPRTSRNSHVDPVTVNKNNSHFQLHFMKVAFNTWLLRHCVTLAKHSVPVHTMHWTMAAFLKVRRFLFSRGRTIDRYLSIARAMRAPHVAVKVSWNYYNRENFCYVWMCFPSNVTTPTHGFYHDG